MVDRSLLTLAQAFFDALDRVRPDTLLQNLTLREIECLSWAAYGCSDKEIAQEIGCAHDTVRFHIKNIVRKLGASNRTHAVAVAIQQGVIRLGGRPRATIAALRH
ncbi:MAG: helix-turn-helix transcriptional regulator [Sinobacteraceae bacterium]|nr:helix-turn-helix transcriptional regulator [Nevskiaceae bacterium]MCP5339236.1 helix-turn-helix transcriptional regulator [Nevskiaceae bacterium]MCP5359415.1 helix-turn-helix transcriptional regulator [Nevskiaceae bacterium]MCP5467314.1 helix-turn-helix transcriptional regulator [Nevskiaceae bacterium]MCP5470854.1 helix-turn-helix transcriptional regulator [Nevskiaceae bacterium]